MLRLFLVKLKTILEAFVLEPEYERKDFTDIHWEIEFLDSIQNNEITRLDKETAYIQKQKINRLLELGLIVVDYKDDDNKVFITDAGKEWVKQFLDARYGSGGRSTAIDPGGWNPVSGALWQGGRI